jgi:A-macroglobulin TED domain
MGQSLSGLGNLLAMPCGCGEQNMIYFAPDVYILKYLQSVGQAADPSAARAQYFLNTGRWPFNHLNKSIMSAVFCPSFID